MTTNEEEFNQMVKNEKYAYTLTKIEIFMHLGRAERLDIVKAFKEIIFNPDQNIIAQGEKVNFFFIILEGEVVVSKKPSSNEAAVEVTILHDGSAFGALPIFFDSPSRVTLKAKNQVKCMYMDRQSFQDIVVPVLKFIERNAQAYHAFIHLVEK